MQFRIRNNGNSAPDGSTSRFLKVSSALFVASSVLVALPLTSEAFVPSAISQHKAPSTTQLFYTMPDVTNMKATEMRQELESYGINTNTLFDKREFEQALIEARRHYEQTLNDVMASTRPKEKKVQAKRKTVNYERSRHRDERIYSSDVNDQPGQQHRYAESQQRRRKHYQAEPNPVGNFNTYPNVNGPQGSRRGPEWFEEDPLFAHERGSFFPDDDHHHYHHDPHTQPQQQQQYEEYEVGSRQRQQARATYSDAAMETKYQTALIESYTMKVEDLQRELNCRGISTKDCMIFKDFCIAYAKAIAESREKKVEDASSAAFEDDSDDYDPKYRDVVMQKYDPSMWV